MKRILSLTLAIIMLIIAVPTFAEYETGEYMGMTYKKGTDAVEITGYTPDLPLTLVMPPEIDGLPVTAIADGAFAESRLLEITIPKTVTHIGEGVFMGCKSSLKIHMEYNDSIKAIDGIAYDENGTVLFYDGSNVYTQKHDYPQFRRIGKGAFSKYAHNMSANFPNALTVGEYAFSEANIYKLSFASLRTIEANAFEYANVGKLYFGELTDICDNAFKGASGELYFCCDAPEISESAFANAKDIKIFYANGMQGWDDLVIDNVTIEMYNPGISELHFYQLFEDTPTDTFFATVRIYNNLSLCDENMPAMPDKEGYIVGCHSLDDIYGVRMTSFVPEDQPPEEPEDPEEPVEIPVYIEEATVYIRYYRDITHTVTFKENIDGTVIDVQKVKRSYDAVYPEAPEYEYYNFDGWGPGIINVTEDREVFATYRLDPKYCMVRFYDAYLLPVSDADPLLQKEIVLKGTKLTYPAVPVHEGYDFIGWSETPEYAYGDFLSIYANYEIQVFTVTFIDTTDNTEFATLEVEYGKDAVMPEPPLHVDYKFSGWSNDGKNVKEDRTIYAYYEERQPRLSTGDANGDGKVDTADAVQVLKSSAGIITLLGDKKKAADTNQDGAVNTADAVLILKYAAGMITAF